ncbi:MAG: VWA domain-containing protein [Planctomycetes bacterium]|nr:VWA domain-containing protein [Planctomycetota bacterium]
MSFLAPWYVPVLAAAATVPPLVVLYFLKLKRQRMPIASTLLWRKAIEDLRVNSPFQRLRSSLLLFLQLLILVLACLAIGEPFKAAGRSFEKAIVLLIDQSASMATVEDNGETRLAIAKREAAGVVEGLTADQRAMVIAFADRARVLASFTADKGDLRRAIDSIQQTDAAGSLHEAVALAEAHSTPVGEGIGIGDQQVSQAHLILLTDGRLPDAEKVAVRRSTIDLVKVGKATANVGIVDLDVRRSYEQPAQLTVLARVRNLGATKVERDLSLVIDGQERDVRPLSLAAAAGPDRLPMMQAGGVPAEGSEAVVPFDVVLDTGANVEVRLSGEDGLAVDDLAFAVVTPPHPMKVLLVTAGNRFLSRLIGVMPLDKFDVWTPQQYQEKPDAELIDNGRCIYDVVVFDDQSTDRLPPGNYFFFGGIPIIDGVQAGDIKEGEVLLDWDDTHPVLQHVVVESLNLVGWRDLKLPKEAVRLIEGTSGPVLALLQRGRNQYLISAFSIFDETRTRLNTDWVYRSDSVAFVYDALRFLAGSTTIGQQPRVAPGQPFSVPVSPKYKNVTVARPDGTTDSVAVGALNMATYSRTDRVGIYTVNTGIPDEGSRAVSLLNEQESLIAPNAAFRMAAGEVKQTGGSELARRPLWPYFLMALGGVLLIEWIVYNKRVYV